MKTSDFYFELPVNLIAQKPAPERGTSRLMILNKHSGATLDTRISSLADYISSRTVVVLNDSRVRKARLFGTAGESGGRVEFLLLEELKPGLWKVLTGKAKKQKPGKAFIFPGGIEGEITGASGSFRLLQFHPIIDDRYLEQHGHIPLPPYIKREDTEEDLERYQTVYARATGSAAAPTAGLHLTEKILNSLTNREIRVVAITLHVGAGTFLPIRSANVEEHVMHEETYHIPESTAQAVNEALRSGGKILAVGTTAVRALESAWSDKGLVPGEGKTDIFIYPGYSFKVVSQLLTNFHTPESTLLLLVSAFTGRERIFSAYREAIQKKYKFFSYGDAMLIQ